ncbi:hypothetical protein B1L11_11870 [Microbispora sp. GKU 823]|nr:hypothetical protein B1L11_11870 [Microbispora sp. GKU 823]
MPPPPYTWLITTAPGSAEAARRRDRDAGGQETGGRERGDRAGAASRATSRVAATVVVIGKGPG